MRIPTRLIAVTTAALLAGAWSASAVNVSSLVPPPEPPQPPAQAEPAPPTSEILSATTLEFGTTAYEIVPHGDPGKLCFAIVSGQAQGVATTMSCWDRKQTPAAE